MPLSKKQLEKKYKCDILKDNNMGGSSYWVATSLDENYPKEDFHFDGWTLKELEDKLKKHKLESE